MTARKSTFPRRTGSLHQRTVPKPRQDSMRTETAKPVRLEDYRPPDWLVETVELDVALHPTATRVRASLSLRPNANGRKNAPLVLDGEELSLLSLLLDNVPLGSEHYAATPS